MAFRITLDRLYPDMKEATIGHWLKQEGDEIALGEPIVELITDKVTFDFESPGAGLLRRIYARDKSVLPIGCTLAVLAGPEEELPDIEAENRERIAAWEAQVAQEKGQTSGPRLVAGVSISRPATGVRATPSARRLAREHGIDLASIPPPADGPITERDVQAFLEAK